MSKEAVQYLLTRRSTKFVRAPGPDDEELRLILESAMRAPDHGRLRPWRFALLRPPAIAELADLALDATRARGTLLPKKEASTRRWLSEVPLLIAIACHIDHSNTKIPEEERMLSTGAAVSNMLNAAHMLGYAAYWSTGLGTYIEEVPEALGFDPLDHRFMGYLAIGTPIDTPEPITRPDPANHVREWRGVGSGSS